MFYLFLVAMSYTKDKKSYILIIISFAGCHEQESPI